MKLSNTYPHKRVLITGAGSGLGRALALEFAKMRWHVAIAEIRQERGRETAALVDTAGGHALPLACDVTRPDDVAAALAEVKRRWGGLDILINNAGITAGGYMEKIPLEEWERIISMNLKSLVFGCRAVIPELKRQQSGYIVNIASCAGLICIPECASYNMTKAAVIAMSETLRAELAPHGIGVSVVCPTFFKTNLMDQFTSTDERQKKIAERFFETSKMTAEEVARHAVKGIERGRFYIIAQRDGKSSWLFKRLFPELFHKAVALIYKKGYFYRVLGINPDEL